MKRRNKDWPIRTETDLKIAKYIASYCEKEFGSNPGETIDKIWDEWPYLSILYTTCDGEDPSECERYDLQVDIDVKMRFTRAELYDCYTNQRYIYDEYWDDEREMLEDLKWLNFDAWFDWATTKMHCVIEYGDDI